MRPYHFLLILMTICIFSSSSAQNKAAVIGGGIAGTSCAYYLQKSMHYTSITLFEKEEILGGNAQTIEVKNGKQEVVKVDAGPQYFSEGPWNDYLHFLNETIGLSSIATESVAGSLLVQSVHRNRPSIITPLNGKLRGEKISRLLLFKKFNEEAFNLHNHPDPWRGKTIEAWVSSLSFDPDFKTEIIYPFLAASLGTSAEEIKSTSAVEIIKLFAFRKPKLSNKFHIVEEGMGTLIGKIGTTLQEKGVHIRTSSPVQSVTRAGEKYVVHSTTAEKTTTDTFDIVILAVHADQAARILSAENSFSPLKEELSKLPYFKAHIVIHKDPRFINTRYPTFLNIHTDDNNQLVSSTMNLSVISPRLEGIYKSWMTEELVQNVKEAHNFLYETDFYHPYITPGFIASVEQLKVKLKDFPGLSIIGGWTEGIETQNSAVISAQKAVEKHTGKSPL